MKTLTRAFWKTLWEDKKMLVIGIVVVLIFSLGVYTWFQMKRSWNWNVGGYKSRGIEMVCEMAENGAIAKGPNFEKECK